MYKIDPDHTNIIFDTKKSDFILVKNKVPYEIEKVVFKLKKAPSTNPFDFLFKGNSKQYIFNTKKLKKIIKNLFPKKTAVGQHLKFNISDIDCIASVKELIFQDKNINLSNKKYATYGLITDKTEFKFEISKKEKSITCNDTSNNNLFENPIMELEKYVGGISDQLEKVIKKICLARGKLKNEFEARGLKAD